MLRFIVIGLLLSSVSCARKKHFRHLDGRISQLEVEKESLESSLVDHEERLKLLEEINILSEQDVNNLFVNNIQNLQSQVLSNSVSIVANQTEIDALRIYIDATNDALNTLDLLDLNDLQVFFADQISVFETQLTNQELTLTQIDINMLTLIDNISRLESRLDQNDLFTDLPTCVHSYFALYNANGTIKSVWVTENDGTVRGAWELSNNTNYNLKIDETITCTNLVYSKNQKTINFVDANGLSQTIDLSY